MVRSCILFLFLSVSAAAQTPPSCMFAEELDASLIDWYGERAVSESGDGTWVLWRNFVSETWTLVKYLDNNLACVAAHGTSSRDLGAAPEALALDLR
ncbi:hypothetical protein Dshi_3428 [Dinoroseobacter shibae DFL 12 = DSM 16493]|uniref:Uncharacterized protein n=1 Tax=Dinoroseobacter shibae (strain DSM 16493 / NCIMB 14021 / DFL 12) TaxID=398580 RepID=A8LP96_DINSH|nr:hypothetical protein Dshi_3428 [Dinoroseobacter shibae DFL 12 = DSM 16493]